MFGLQIRFRICITFWCHDVWHDWCAQEKPQGRKNYKKNYKKLTEIYKDRYQNVPRGHPSKTSDQKLTFWTPLPCQTSSVLKTPDVHIMYFRRLRTMRSDRPWTCLWSGPRDGVFKTKNILHFGPNFLRLWTSCLFPTPAVVRSHPHLVHPPTPFVRTSLMNTPYFKYPSESVLQFDVTWLFNFYGNILIHEQFPDVWRFRLVLAITQSNIVLNFPISFANNFGKII